MTASVWWWLLAAGFLFWLVGLHNRITRQRARAIEVLCVLEKQVRVCASLVLERQDALCVAHEEEVQSAHALLQWQTFVSAAQSVECIWGQVHKNALNPAVQAQRAECWFSLQAAWMDLIASPQDLAGPPVPDDFKNAWEASVVKATAVQRALNGIIETYNHWVQEFPARLVARRMGFEASATI